MLFLALEFGVAKLAGKIVSLRLADRVSLRPRPSDGGRATRPTPGDAANRKRERNADNGNFDPRRLVSSCATSSVLFKFAFNI